MQQSGGLLLDSGSTESTHLFNQIPLKCLQYTGHLSEYCRHFLIYDTLSLAKYASSHAYRIAYKRGRFNRTCLFMCQLFDILEFIVLLLLR